MSEVPEAELDPPVVDVVVDDELAAVVPSSKNIDANCEGDNPMLPVVRTASYCPSDCNRLTLPTKMPWCRLLFDALHSPHS